MNSTYGGSYGRWGRSYGATSTMSSSSSSSSHAVSTPTVSTLTPSIASSSSSYYAPSTSAYVPSSSVAAALSPSLTPSIASSSSYPTVSQGSGNVPFWPSSYPGGDGALYEAAGGADDAVYVGEGDDNGPGMYSEEPTDGRGSHRSRRSRRYRRGKGYPASSRRRRAAMLAAARRRAAMRQRPQDDYDDGGNDGGDDGGDDDFSGALGRWGRALGAFFGAPLGTGEILGRGVLAGRSYYKKQGSGGYVYLQFTDDGGITVDPSSPAKKGQYLQPRSSSVWYAITKEIGPLAKDKAAVSAHYAQGHKAAAQIPTSVVVTGQKNQWIDNLFSAIGQGSSADGQKLVAQAAVQHGPEVADAAAQYLQEKKSSPAAIQKKIDRLMAQLAAAKAKGNHVKVKKLQAKIKGLQARLLQAQSDAAGAIDSTTLTAPSTFPWKYVLGGILGVAILGVLARSFAK